jgi:hypothetical protein
VEPLLDERDMMTLEYDNQVGGVGTEPFVELAQWKILGVKGTAQRSYHRQNRPENIRA